ncbi:hypothetical protein PC123_g21083 [Phytophthora cactorum]|nr:hypothetical protein PC120_g22166 [Phytophthora cactorum]KAG4043446.1 hypothetical protein PC123_g21083 [Phytophthora cactorum]
MDSRRAAGILMKPLPSLRGTFDKGDDDTTCHFGPTSAGQALRRDWRETWVQRRAARILIQPPLPSDR